MKKTTIILIVIAVLIVGILLYRELVPPTFYIVSGDNLTHKGTYRFGNVENYYGNGSGVQGGRAGWQLSVLMNEDGTTTFTLMKRSRFVRVLGTH